jgi:dihydrofolate reductase
MGEILVHEFATLDGVVDAPTWTVEFGFDPRMGEALAELTNQCEAILLGRNTYEMFAQAWPQRTVEDDPGAPFFNDTPKHVVSATLEDPAWNNTAVLGPYDANAIRGLKESVAGGIYVSGSGTLVRAMLADKLVDELHLCVYPTLRGDGPRLHGESDPIDLRLVRYEQYGNGVLYLVYKTGAGG